MSKHEVAQPYAADNTVRALRARSSWLPKITSLVALDPARWSQRHQQTTSWLLVEFLNTQRNLH